MEHLIQQGANIEAKATNGVTPLMNAAETGNVPLVGLLLQSGANPSTKDDQDEIALTHAARGGWLKVVDLLARFSNSKEKNQALFAAVEAGPVTIEIRDAPAQSAQPKNQAAAEIEESWTETVESLLASGADIEARNLEGSTPLIWAASFAQTDIVNLLLRRGARLDATDKYGNTPLISAACECAIATMNSAYDVTKMLLDHGAQVNARSKDGTTALMNAASGFGSVDIVKLLLNKGADPRAKDDHGNTPLLLARQRRRADKIRLLREALARAN